MEKIVIIGSNHAGTAATNNILDNYPDKEVVVYDKNSNISFLGCGMALWIGEQIHSGDGLFYASPDGLQEKGAAIHMQADVTGVDLDNKKLTIRHTDGTETEDSYDKLILATGSIPHTLPVSGFDLENIQMVKLYQNAQEVIEKIRNKDYKKVAVLGGGYIGIELAEAFRRLDKEVILLDMVDHILNVYFDTPFSDKMKEVMEEKGIRFALGEKVEAFIGDQKVEGVRTDKGEYEADMVICCIGFRPNSDLLKDKLETYRNGAYLVNKKQQTSHPDVFAIGDCATVYDNARQRPNYIALATNAVRSGIVAAHNACGTEIESLGVQGSSALQIYGYNLVCTGMTVEAAEREGVDVLYTDFTDTQKPAFMEVENPEVKIRIVYRKSDRVVVGAQLGSFYDVSAQINLFSLAIQKGVTIDEIALLDIFFMPHFNQPYNYITMAAITAE